MSSKKLFTVKLFIIFNFIINQCAFADNHNIYEVLEIIKKDLKTLERAVYSDSTSSEIKENSEVILDQNSEDVLTRHLLKLTEIENQFQDLTNNASNKLEGWIDDQIIETSNESIDDSYKTQNDHDSYDDWIDNLDIDSSEEFNTMKKRQRKKGFINEKDLDPWI